MILTMPPAVPLAAGATCTHPRTLAAFVSFPRNTGGADTRVTLDYDKEKLGEEFPGGRSRLGFKKTSLVWFSACVQPLSFVCGPNRWQVPRLRGRTASGLPNRPASANPTNAESSRSRCCMTPGDSKLLGR